MIYLTKNIQISLKFHHGDRLFTKPSKPRSPKKTLRKTAIAFSQNHQTAIAEKDVMKYRDRFFTKRAKPRSRNKYVTKDRDRFFTKLSENRDRRKKYVTEDRDRPMRIKKSDHTNYFDKGFI